MLVTTSDNGLRHATLVTRAGRLAGAVVALTMLAGASANALTLSTIGGAADTLQSNFSPWGWTVDANHDFVGVGQSIVRFDNSMAGGVGVGLSVDGPALVTFTYLGTEASYKNLSFTGPTQTFDNKVSLVWDTAGPYSAAAGFIPFTFTSVDGGGSAVNGLGIDPTVKIAFAIVSPTRAYAFLEDIAQNGDGDFDDMVVRIDIAPDQGQGQTPLPAALPLFAGALGVVGWFSRRRRNEKRAA